MLLCALARTQMGQEFDCSLVASCSECCLASLFVPGPVASCRLSESPPSFPLPSCLYGAVEGSCHRGHSRAQLSSTQSTNDAGTWEFACSLIQYIWPSFPPPLAASHAFTASLEQQATQVFCRERYQHLAWNLAIHWEPV